MQFATIFLIASAVLALPSGSDDYNAAAGHLKRADGFVFPDDDRRDVYVANKDTKVPTNGRIVYPDEFESDYTLKEPDTRIHFPDEDNQAQNGQDQDQNGQDQAQNGQDQNAQTSDERKYKPHPFNDATDSQGQSCSVYKDVTDLNAIPLECYRPFFCDFRFMTRNRDVCTGPRFTSEVLDKEELIKKVKDTECMGYSICRSQDINHLPFDS